MKDEHHDLLKDLLVWVVNDCREALGLSTCVIRTKKSAALQYMVTITAGTKSAGKFFFSLE